MRSMHSAERTIFLQFKLAWGVFLVLGRRIIPTLASPAGKGDNISHFNYPITEKNYPAPSKIRAG